MPLLEQSAKYSSRQNFRLYGIFNIYHDGDRGNVQYSVGGKPLQVVHTYAHNSTAAHMYTYVGCKQEIGAIVVVSPTFSCLQGQNPVGTAHMVFGLVVILLQLINVRVGIAQ